MKNIHMVLGVFLLSLVSVGAPVDAPEANEKAFQEYLQAKVDKFVEQTLAEIQKPNPENGHYYFNAPMDLFQEQLSLLTKAGFKRFAHYQVSFQNNDTGAVTLEKILRQNSGRSLETPKEVLSSGYVPREGKLTISMGMLRYLPPGKCNFAHASVKLTVSYAISDGEMFLTARSADTGFTTQSCLEGGGSSAGRR
jgi:hypothetical protein